MRQVRDIIEGSQLIYVAPSDTVREAAKRMAENNIGAVPVLDDGALVGVFSERDVMSRVVARDQNPGQTRVADVMTRQIVAAEPEETVDDCVKKMQSMSCRHLPVVDNGRLVGMISLRDLLQVEADERQHQVDFLNELVTYSADYES